MKVRINFKDIAQDAEEYTDPHRVVIWGGEVCVYLTDSNHLAPQVFTCDEISTVEFPNG